MRRITILAVVLAATVACDDTLFGGGAADTDTGSGWCAVQSLFEARCVSCHSPSGGTQGALDLKTDAHAALVGVASAYPGRTLVVAGDPAGSFLLAKLEGTQAATEGGAMPLGGALSASTIEVVRQWIADGATSECTVDTGPPPECNTDHEDCRPGVAGCGGESGTMDPGADCLTCHRYGGDEEAPRWTAAGTAFTDVWGTDGLAGATVHLTDADGKTVSLTTNRAGNFYTQAALTMPIRASIVTDAGTLEMTTAQDTAACNSCHRCDGEAGGKLFGP